MGEITRNHFYTVDMDKPLMRQDCGVLLAEGDNNGDCFSFALNRGGVALALDNAVSVTMYFVRQDGFTVFLDGECTGNRVNVTLPAHCYSVEGRFSLAVKASLTGETVTIAVIDGFIRSTYTGNIADPTEAIPSLDELFAHIEAMEAATEATKAATENAKTVTNAAINTMLDLMQTAAPVIIQNADGDGIVAVSDSAERSLSGMSVYGKTTQDGTPTPEAPVPMVNVGNGGSISINVRGKNLFDMSALSNQTGAQHEMNGNAVRIYTTSSGAYRGCRIPAITMYAGNKYVVTADVSNVVSGTPNIGLRNADTMSYLKRTAESDGRIVLTYTPTETVRAYVCLLVTAGTASDGDATFSNVQFEVGASATAYEPFMDGGSMTALTPNGLPGIPVTSGGNYIDASGQQWVCDEIDFTRKVHVKRLHTLTLDGSQTMRWYPDDRMPFGGVMQLTLSSSYHAAIPHKNHAISDKFVNKNNVAASFLHGVFGVTVSGQSMFFAIEGVTTAEAAKAWFTANPTIILYALATPIETPLSPEELTGSTSLTAQYPTTTAMNDAGAGMKMDYIADTKIYIDQRIAALLNA